MKKVMKIVAAAVLACAAPMTGAVELKAAPADQAVTDYLRLRRDGKRHAEALATVRKEYNLTDAQINDAAKHIGAAGLASDDLAAVSERTPSSDE